MQKAVPGLRTRCPPRCRSTAVTVVVESGPSPERDPTTELPNRPRAVGVCAPLVVPAQMQAQGQHLVELHKYSPPGFAPVVSKDWKQSGDDLPKLRILLD